MDSSVLARNVVAGVQDTTAGVYPASFKEGSRDPRAMMECARIGPIVLGASEGRILRRFTDSPVSPVCHQPHFEQSVGASLPPRMGTA